MDHLQNQLEITNLLKRVNIPNQIFKKMIKDNQSGNLIKYNNNMVLKDYSDSDTNSEQSHESEDDVHLAKRNLTEQIKQFENKIGAYIIRGSSLSTKDQLKEMQSILDRENGS